MAQSKTRGRISELSSDVLSQNSYDDSYSESYTTYGSGSEPDYILLEIRIKQQSDDLSHLQKQNRRLAEDIDLERAQGLHKLKKLEVAARAAEKRILELSTELKLSQDTVKHYQDTYERQVSKMQDLAAEKENQEDRRRIEARIESLEAEIWQIKEEIKNGNYESTQQRAAIRKADEERCISQRLLEASEKERGDLAKKLAELELLNKRQERALAGTAQSWLKKNQQMDVLKEEIRWKMVDTHGPGGFNNQQPPPGLKRGQGASMGNVADRSKKLQPPKVPAAAATSGQSPATRQQRNERDHRPQTAAGEKLASSKSAAVAKG